MSDIKQRLFDHCVDFLNKRIEVASEAIRTAQQSANEETKSSAGDKYETGRAMMQIEIEKNGAQLEEALKQKKALQGINIMATSGRAQPGSLVLTDQGNFFIAISVGVVVLNGMKYAIVSPQSPVGASLLGMSKGGTMQFNGKPFRILEVK